MAIQAKWYNKEFKCSSKVINLIDGLSTSYEINEETKTDKNGKSKTVKKDLKSQNVSFSISPVYAMGIKPRNEFESYKKLIGKTGRLYIGGKAFGPYLMLISSTLSNVILDNKGNMLSCTIALNFEQSTKKKYTTDAKKLKAEKKKKIKNKKAKNATKKTITAGEKVVIVGSKYADGETVSKADKNKKHTVKKSTGSTATLSNGRQINISGLSLS